MDSKRALTIEMERVANLVRREIDSILRQLDFDETSRSNVWIIDYLVRHQDSDVFQRNIEREFSLTRSNISKVVDLMVQKGLIVRSPVEYDARLKKLSLTPKAIGINRQMRQEGEQFEERLLQGFSEQEIAQMRSYLHRMSENLGYEEALAGESKP